MAVAETIVGAGVALQGSLLIPYSRRVRSTETSGVANGVVRGVAVT